jgi:hypothetical protein
VQAQSVTTGAAVSRNQTNPGSGSRGCLRDSASRRGGAARRRAGKSARSRLGMRIPEKAVAPTRDLATGSSHFQYLYINEKLCARTERADQSLLTDQSTHTARDSKLGSGNHDMSRLATSAYPNDTPVVHSPTDGPLRLLSTDIGCGTFAPRSRQDTATHTARDSKLGSGNHDMPRLPALAYPNGAPIHSPTDEPLNGYWVWHLRPSPLSTRHGNTHRPRLKTRQW